MAGHRTFDQRPTLYLFWNFKVQKVRSRQDSNTPVPIIRLSSTPFQVGNNALDIYTSNCLIRSKSPLASSYVLPSNLDTYLHHLLQSCIQRPRHLNTIDVKWLWVWCPLECFRCLGTCVQGIDTASIFGHHNRLLPPPSPSSRHLLRMSHTSCNRRLQP